MNNVLRMNNWSRRTVQVHAETPPITFIQDNNNDKLDKSFVKIKLRRDLTSENSDLYEFKMALFDNS